MKDQIKFDKLSVIIPCFNEFGHVARFQAELISPFVSKYPASEFIFIDDGSTDSTLSALEDLKRAFPSVRVASHPQNRGMGAAVKTGFEHVTGDLVLILDGDLTFHPSQVELLLSEYGEGVDCVTGSATLGWFENVSCVRRFLSRGVNFCYRILLGRSITSVSSIFRIYRTSVLRSLHLRANDFNINAEIIYELIFQGAVIKEVPVKLTSRQWGKSKINIFREIKNHITLFIRIIARRLSGEAPA